MIIEVEDKELESLILYGKSRKKKYSQLGKSKNSMRDLTIVINTLRTVQKVDDLRSFGSLHFERLKYNLSGYCSVRIGYKSKYRMLFTEHAQGIVINIVEINEHYGDK